MKKIIFFMLSVLFTTGIRAQEKTEEFKPFGKPFFKVFTNFHSAITEEKYHNAFEVQRAYLGYSAKLSKKFSGKVTLDVGNPGDGGKLDMTAYLKNAYLQYKSGNFTTKFGLIGRNQFGMQEKQWGGRYLFKSFQDQHKFGSSADLGITVTYKLHDMVSIDASVENGEGYKKLENDSVLKYSTGLTFKPIKGLSIRGYYDYMNKEEAQQTLSTYLGYSIEGFNIGAEYNKQLSFENSEGHDWDGYSFYASYKLEKFRFFGRFDQLYSFIDPSEGARWNFDGDGKRVIAGLEYSPVKGIKLAPNYQLWMLDNDAPSESVIYLSCEISF